MKFIRYLFKTKRVYLVLGISIFLIFFSNFFLINTFVDNINILNTLNNCSAESISIDRWQESKNSYKYFENSYISKSIEEEEVLNAIIYQFVDVKYTDFSILNSKNVIEGSYKILEEGECCVSKNLATSEGLKIGDKLYVNDSIICEIKFLTNEFYETKNINLNTRKSSIFLGKDTLKIESDLYLNCEIDSTEQHNSIYSLYLFKKDAKNNIILYSSISFLVTIISLIIATIIKFKTERITFKNLKKDGVLRLFSIRILNEVAYLFPVLLIVNLSLILLNATLIHLIVTNVSIVLFSIIHLLFLVFEKGRKL